MFEWDGAAMSVPLPVAVRNGPGAKGAEPPEPLELLELCGACRERLSPQREPRDRKSVV